MSMLGLTLLEFAHVCSRFLAFDFARVLAFASSLVCHGMRSPSCMFHSFAACHLADVKDLPPMFAHVSVMWQEEEDQDDAQKSSVASTAPTLSGKQAGNTMTPHDPSQHTCGANFQADLAYSCVPFRRTECIRPAPEVWISARGTL